MLNRGGGSRQKLKKRKKKLPIIQHQKHFIVYCEEHLWKWISLCDHILFSLSNKYLIKYIMVPLIHIILCIIQFLGVRKFASILTVLSFVCVCVFLKSWMGAKCSQMSLHLFLWWIAWIYTWKHSWDKSYLIMMYYTLKYYWIW